MLLALLNKPPPLLALAIPLPPAEVGLLLEPLSLEPVSSAPPPIEWP